MQSLQGIGWTHQETKRVCFVFLIAFAVCVPSLFWQNIPTRDSSLYALLSLEFSAGNFKNSFSPDLSPLLTTIGGSINYFVGHPFLSNQMASILLFLPGVLGTYLLARELKGSKVAFVASILYAVCPYTVELATSGGVDAGKLGLLPWLAWATLKWCRNGGLIWGLWLGFIGGLLSYARGEGFLFSIFALMVCTTSFVFSRYSRKRIQPLAKPLTSLLAASITMALIISPWVMYEHEQTGYLVTHPSQIRVYRFLGSVESTLLSEARASSTIEKTGNDVDSKEPSKHTEIGRSVSKHSLAEEYREIGQGLIHTVPSTHCFCSCSPFLRSSILVERGLFPFHLHWVELCHLLSNKYLYRAILSIIDSFTSPFSSRRIHCSRQCPDRSPFPFHESRSNSWQYCRLSSLHCWHKKSATLSKVRRRLERREH